MSFSWNDEIKRDGITSFHEVHVRKAPQRKNSKRSRGIIASSDKHWGNPDNQHRRTNPYRFTITLQGQQWPGQQRSQHTVDNGPAGLAVFACRIDWPIMWSYSSHQLRSLSLQQVSAWPDPTMKQAQRSSVKELQLNSMLHTPVSNSALASQCNCLEQLCQ